MRSNRLKILGEIATVDHEKVLVIGALRTTAVTLGLAIAAWVLGTPQNAIPLAVSALFVGLAEAGLPVGHRWRIMLWTTTWLMFTAALGFLVAPSIFLTVLVSACVALVAGWVGVAGPRSALIGTLSLVIFTITAGLPEVITLSLDFVALMGLGGLAQTFTLVLTVLLRNPKALRVPPEAMDSLLRRLRSPGEQRERYTRHALRLASAIAVANMISEYYSVPHQYWIPMTVAWIARPDSGGTVVRVAQRVGGTIFGVSLLVAWGIWLPKPQWALIIAIGIGAYLTFAFIWANYTIAVFGITIFIISIFALAGDLLENSVFFRVGATLAAALIVLATLVVIREPKQTKTDGTFTQ
jgi:MFS family permease